MEKRYRVEGMTCAACERTVENAVKKLSGVQKVSVSLMNKVMVVDFDADLANDLTITEAVSRSGYKARAESSSVEHELPSRTSALGKQKNRLIISLGLLIVLFYLSMGPMIGLGLPEFLTGPDNFIAMGVFQLALTAGISALNWRFFATGLKTLVRLKPNMDSLVAIGSMAAIVYSLLALLLVMLGQSVHEDNHLFFEAAGAILTFVSIGKYLEEKSKYQTTSAVRKLLDLTPKTVLVEKNGVITEAAPENLMIDDLIVIKPGMAVPVDGIIVRGESDIDESLITGEVLPVYKETGDRVIAGTINKTGSFVFKAEKVGRETTIAKIIALVEQATMQKLPIQRLADKISGIFVPVVIGISLVTFTAWMLSGSEVAFALNNAIAVLVISCPCALGLATPVAIMVATGKGAETGILLKNPEVLEVVPKLTAVIFDKTGTITKGEPVVSDLINIGFASDTELLAYASSLEGKSEHPIARAIVKGQESNSGIEVANFRSHAGLGVSGTIAGESICIGNQRFMVKENIDIGEYLPTVEKLQNEGKTVILIGRNQLLAGIVAVIDEIKPSSYPAVQRLKKQALKLILLSGDNQKNVDLVQTELGLDEALGDLSPKDKSEYVKSLQNAGEKVAMVGDGINDAVALTAADVGIAIGAGSDVAISSADIVLMKSELSDVGSALTLSNQTLKTIKANLFWAFAYNLLALPVAAGVLYPFLGITLDPMIAAAAMSLSSISVVLNALRLKKSYMKEESKHESKVHSR